MKFIVELLAFGKPGEVREVSCPSVNSPDPSALLSVLKVDWLAIKACEEAFRYGQNETQPQDHPSVSAGDVIHIGEDRWLILATGFKKLTPNEYLLYKEMPLSKRMMIPYLITSPEVEHRTWFDRWHVGHHSKSPDKPKE